MCRSRWRCILALFVLALFSPCADSKAAQAPSLEHSIKATFLYKFAQFVEWPDSAFESADAPVSVCVLGNDAVTEALDRLVVTELADERPYQTRHLDRVDRDSMCHILYIADPATQAAADALGIVSGMPVLTVADAAQTPQSSAVINFVIDRNRVRFDIDDAAAVQNGLSISSRLLTLARMVRPRP